MNYEQLSELAEALSGWTMDQVKQDADDIESGVACVGCLNDDGSFAEVFAIDTGLYFADDSAIKMANFYAAANPTAVLALLDRIKALEDELEALKASLGDPACEQFQSKDGSWHGFINEQHRVNTVESGGWPIRKLYAVKEPT